MDVMILMCPHPNNHTIAARLEPGKSVEILHEFLAHQLENGGISVSREFREEHKTGWRVYPSDDPSLFARAFEQCFYPHGPLQLGYTWKNERNYFASQLTAEQLVDLILGRRLPQA